MKDENVKRDTRQDELLDNWEWTAKNSNGSRTEVKVFMKTIHIQILWRRKDDLQSVLL